MVAYFWLFSSYHLATFITWWASHQLVSTDKVLPPLGNEPAVAIAYTVFNDFIEECAASCLEVEYRNYHLFVCDDSTDASMRDRVTGFAVANRDRCTLVRRSQQTDFKAGNLNHLLTGLPAQYEYLLLVDSDSMIAPGFLRSAASALQRDRTLAFVQACHSAYIPATATSFQRAVGPGVQCMWRFMSVKNRYGMAPMFGHGVLLAIKALNAAGNFPLRVSEDLALTARLRTCGYGGVIADSVWCKEGIPATFGQYRRRFEKWVIGTLEFVLKDARQFFKNHVISLGEKLDLAFSLLGLLNVLVLLTFVVVVNVVWPMTSGIWRVATLEVKSLGVSTVFPMLDITGLLQGRVTLGPRLAVCIASLASLVYFLPDLRRYPIRTVAHISNGFTCFCGVLVPCFLSSLLSVATGRYIFRVTGDMTESARWRRGWGNLADNFYVGRKGSVAIEIFFGCAAFSWAILSGNLFLAAIALGIWIAPLLERLGWESLPAVLLRHVPFSLFFLQLWFIAFPGLGSAGLTNQVVLIHF